MVDEYAEILCDAIESLEKLINLDQEGVSLPFLDQYRVGRTKQGLELIIDRMTDELQESLGLSG